MSIAVEQKTMPGTVCRRPLNRSIQETDSRNLAGTFSEYQGLQKNAGMNIW